MRRQLHVRPHYKKASRTCVTITGLAWMLGCSIVRIIAQVRMSCGMPQTVRGLVHLWSWPGTNGLHIAQTQKFWLTCCAFGIQSLVACWGLSLRRVTVRVPATTACLGQALTLFGSPSNCQQLETSQLPSGPRQGTWDQASTALAWRWTKACGRFR